MANRSTLSCYSWIALVVCGLLAGWQLCSAANSKSQTDTNDVYNLSFSQLSKLRISSASKVSQQITEVPATVAIVTATEIRDRGYFTLEEVLSDLPGFQFRGIPGFNTYVFQRGFPNQNNMTLVLVDGVQINELNSGGFYAGGQYNLANIERIEIVYGPSSVAYGTNAMSGIINIITKSARSNYAEASASVGSFSTSKADFVYSLTDENHSYALQASGMVKKSNKSDLKGSAGDNNWTDLLDNFENDYSFDLKAEALDFTFGTNYQYKQASAAVWFKSVGTNTRDYGSTWNIQFVNNYLKYKKKLTDKLSIASSLYNRNTTVLDNTVYYVLDTSQVGYYRPNNLTGIEAIMNYVPTDFLTVTGGLTFEWESIAKSASLSQSKSPYEKPPTPADPDMLHNTLISGFVEPRANIGGLAFVSAGVRIDHSSVYDDVLTPSAGLVVPFFKHRFRASYSEAFRAPKPWDYTDGLGNASLQPERVNSFEAGLTLSFWDCLKIDASGYISHIHNAIIKQYSGTSFLWDNGGQKNTNGVMLQLNYSRDDLSACVNYTYSESSDTSSVEIPEISKHTINASVTYTFNKYLRLNLRANYVGERENLVLIKTNGSKYIDPYFVLHGALNLVDYNGINVQLAVKNIFDKEYYHTSNRPPDRYRQAQRTILLTFGLCLPTKKQG